LRMKRAMAVMLVVVGAAAIAACGNSPPATGASTTSKPGREAVQVIHEKIEKGIVLLEAGKDREALEALANPIDVAKWKKNGEFDRVVSEFGAEGRKSQLMAALKAAAGQAPTLNEAKSQAEFPHPEGERGLIFTRSKDEWYIQN
jgi:hypothetical protein